MAVPDSVKPHIERLATDGLLIFRSVLLEFDKYVTGETLQSIRPEIQFKRDRTLIRYYGIDTFDFRIRGRKAGTPPPIGPLSKWVEERNLDINPYALQKSIANNGTVTPAIPYFETVESRLSPKLEQFLQRDDISLLFVKRLDNIFSNSNRRR